MHFFILNVSVFGLLTLHLFKYVPILAFSWFMYVLLVTQFNYKLKKHVCSDWDSNQGPLYGRLRRIH